MFRTGIIFLSAILTHGVIAQSNSTKPTQASGSTFATDTAQINLMHRTANKFSNEGTNIDSALFLATEVLNRSKAIGYTSGVFDGHFLLGVIYYYNKAERTRGAEEYEKALALAHKMNNKKYLIHSYYALGIVYDHTQDTASAYRYFQKAYTLSKAFKDEHLVMLTAGPMLNYLPERGESLRPLKLTLDSLRQTSQQASVQAGIVDLLTTIYRLEDRPHEAIELLKQSLSNENQKKQIYKTVSNMIILANLYNQTGQPQEEKRVLEETIKIGSITQDAMVSGHVVTAYDLLSKVYAKERKFKEAWQFSTKAMNLRDSLSKLESLAELQALQVSFDVDRKKLEIEVLTKDKEIRDQADARKMLILALLATGCFVLIGFALFLFRSNVRKKRMNVLLADKNQRIEQQHTELKNTLEELHATQEQLLHSEKMASLGNMTSGIAHEINNPLSFIQAGAQTLNYSIQSLQELLTAYEKLEANPSPETFAEIESIKNKIYYDRLLEDIKTMLKAIQNGTTRTSNIIAGLQSFSRKGTEHFIKRDLQQLIEDTLLLVRIESKNRVALECSYEKNLVIACRAGELGQVLLNLFINALQAITDKGTIYVTTRNLGDQAEIKIRDTGSGIPKEIQSKIFDPFFTTKDVGKGTGLGLSITHGIIKNHGGEITVQSEIGKGTEFTIMLPIQHAQM